MISRYRDLCKVFFTGPEGTYNSASNYISRVGNEGSMDVNAVDELIPRNADKTIKTVKLENGKTKFTSGKENVDAWQDVGYCSAPSHALAAWLRA